VSTYCYVDTILYGATLEIKMGSPDAYPAEAIAPSSLLMAYGTETIKGRGT
jgi:hypothetical protein